MKICDLKGIFSIFFILFITTVSTQNLSPVLCGGLHEGVNPCKKCSENQAVLVKSKPLPKSLAIDTAATQMKSQVNYEWKSGLRSQYSRPQISNKRMRPHMRNSAVIQMKPTNFEKLTYFEKPVQYVPQIHQVQQIQRAQQIQQVQLPVPAIEPDVKFVPKFHPIGDLCFEKENKLQPVNRVSEATIITPANPPKIECYSESSPVMPMRSPTMLNTMMKSQVIADGSAVQIPQLSSTTSQTKFRLRGSSRQNKARGGLISTGFRPLHVNPARNNIKMRDYTVDLSAQHLNKVKTPRLRSEVMRSGVRMDNTMNGFNVYSGNSAVIGAAPITTGIQRMPYLSNQRAAIFGSSVDSFGENNYRRFINEASSKNNGMFLSYQNKMHLGGSTPISSVVDSPADLVSLSLKYKNLIESCQQAASNIGGVNRVSTKKVSEKQLSYGPQRTPINDQVEETPKEVPEENLHVVDKPVIELQLDRPSPTLRSFEGSAPAISYSDLGFKEKKFDSPRFQEKSMVFKAPIINQEQYIQEKGLDYYLPYPPAETTVVGQLLPAKPVSLECVPANSHFTSSVVHNSAHQLIPPVQSYSQIIQEPPTLRSYSVTSKNVGQLSNNNQMSSPSNNKEICYCTEV